MVTRREILIKAADDCMKDIYKHAQPKVDWDDFVQQCKDYTKKYKEWESINENRPNVDEFCGPKPYEFYYLPKEVLKDIYDSYVHAYKIDNHQELLDTIKILKNYCNDPIVDKYIEGETDKDGNKWPGHRGYDHPDNLEKEVNKLLGDSIDKKELSKLVCSKFFEFLDMAGNYYNWNRELNGFGLTIYLGVSPSSNKESVIENWKEHKNIDITIDDDCYKEDFDSYEEEDEEGDN